MDAALLEALLANTSYSGVRVESIAGRAVHAVDSLYGTQYGWINGDILFWVIGSDDVGARAVGAMPGSSVPLVPGGEAAGVTTVDLTIGSGPDAGTYHAVAETGGCSKDALGKDQFGLQYSTTDPAVPFQLAAGHHQRRQRRHRQEGIQRPPGVRDGEWQHLLARSCH